MKEASARGSSFSSSHLAAIVVAVAYAAFIARHAMVYAMGPDISGYVNLARLLMRGTTWEPLRLPAGLGWDKLNAAYFTPWEYNSMGSELGTRLVASRSVGWPLQLALMGRILGLHGGGVAALALLGAATLWLTYRLALDLGLSRGWALSSMVAMGLYSSTLLSYLWPMSDGPATTWCTLSVYLALLSGSRGWAVPAAGFAVGMSVLVRQPAALMTPAVLYALLRKGGLAPRGSLARPLPPPPPASSLRSRSAPLSSPGDDSAVDAELPGDGSAAFSFRSMLRRTLAFGAGAAGPALVHFLREHQLYAHGPPSMSFMFSVSYMPARLKLFGALLAMNLGRPAVVLWLCSFLLAPFLRELRLLLLWAVPFILFHATYGPVTGWTELRYLVPAHGAILLTIALVARWLHETWVRASHGALWARWLGWAAIGGLYASILPEVVHARNSVNMVGSSAPEENAGAWLERRVPTRSVVVSSALSGELYCYTKLPILRWDNVTASELARLRDDARRGGVRVYAFLDPSELSGFGAKFSDGFREIDRADLGRVLLAAE